MRDRCKRVLAILLVIAMTMSNFPDSFVSGLVGLTSLELTAEGETESVSGNTESSSNDAGSVTETESQTEEETEVVVVDVETETEEAGIMLTSTSTDTLQSLINATGTTSTTTTVIQLTADYTEDLEIGDGINVTIDLNGHTITSAGTSKNAVMVYGTLIITDSSEGGAGAIKNGDGVSARGIDVAQGASLTIAGGTITGFSAGGNGGGVLVENGGTFAMTGGTISGNTASGYGGGLFMYDASQIASITGGTISGNTASLSGGGLAANLTSTGVVTFNSGLTISGNTSGGYGGGVYFNSVITTLTISSTISGNTSTSEGGGVYFGATVTTLNITDATIDGNTSGAAGGGAYFAVAVPTATISGSSISGNQAAGNGGGIWLNAGTSLTLEDSDNNTSRINKNIISAEGALFGGGIFLYSTSSNRSTFISTGGEISGNTIDSKDLTNSYGGGISIGSTAANAYASVNMSNTTVSNNSGATYGGGISIYNYAQEATFTNLTVSGNKAVASAASGTGYGGGVYIAGNSACTVTVSGGIFSGNSADYYGGGMYVTTATSSLVLQDAAKFDGNTSYNGGGGIYTDGQLTLAGGDSTDNAVVICNNVSTIGVGGGVYSATSNSYAITSTGYVDVYGNSAGTNGGGLCVNAGGMDLSGHITIHDNYSKGTNYGGAGLYSGSNTTGTIWLHDGVYIYDNTSNLHGGGVYSRWGLKIDDGVYIYGNYANSNGGGVDAITLDMSGGEIHDNSAANGGGVYIVQGTAGSVNPESSISGGKIYNNTARTGSGGGVYENSYPNILYIKGDVEIYDNSAYSNGGGVYACDLFSFSGGIITGNTAQKGGGVYIAGYLGQNATIEISGTGSGIIYDNTATTVNYGNDVAMGYSSSYTVSSDNSTGKAYPSLSMGAASAFTDKTNDITGVSWYDEVDDTTTEDAISTYITSSTQQAGQYYTLVYKTVEAAIAEIWNTEDNKYETFTSVQEAVDAVESNSNVYGTYGGTDDTITIIMLDDNREDVTIPTGVSVTLDLAGCTLTGLAKSVITVDSGATLVIDDSSAEGTGLITGGDGTYYNYNGTSYNYCGGGLLVIGTATFVGGTISGNTAQLGGGVFVAGHSGNNINGTFILDGGTITGNTATSNGGGLAVYSGYTSSTYRTAETPNFTMNSGTITANKGGSGGGVYVYVYVNVEITGGSITNNTCSSSTSMGGGMYIASQTLFNMTGGLITGNTAVTGGGIYSNNINSNLTFSEDTQIYGNTATSNVANDIYATITGGSISVLAAPSMGNASYNSWFDSNGDDSSYPYYYTEELSYSKISNHIFALTATNYSGGYVAYIAETTSGNTVYQIDNGDGTYSYTVEADTAAASTVSASASGTAYATLQAAINAAVTGDTIYLLCDVEESLSISGLATRTGFTIDLNGYTVYSTGDYGFYIKYANSVGMDITIQSTSGTFANTESDAVGTITVADSNSSSFPYGIYIPAGNVDYETYLTVDSVLITGFGNVEQADASGSSTYSGAGIYTSSYNSVTLTGTTKISGNYAYQGGGVYMTGYNIYLTMGEDVVISGNTAYQGGGVCFNASGDGGSETDGVFTYKGYTETVTINGSEISGNTSTNSAGGLYIIGWNSTYNTSEGDWPGVTITGATIKENTAGTEVGGAYLLRVSNATITGSYITDNYSTTQYGGMYLNASGNPGVNALYTVTDSYFTGNTSGTGYAGLIVGTGVANISNCTFTQNTSSTGCAALYLNTVASGSTLTNCTFTGNESTVSGYIIYITSSFVDISDIEVTRNSTATNTGAVCIHANSGTIKGEVTITGSDISNNSGYGLDLYLQNDMGEIVTVTNTTITNNFGYGIYMRQSNNHYKTRSEYVLNIGDGVEVAYNGNTGIYANGYGHLNITGGKIHDNTGASTGGGVYAAYTDFNMSGGEIYDNSATKGGGVYLVESANTYNGGTYSDVEYNQAATDTITGGKIYDNTSSVTTDSGGGIYVGNYDKLVMTGGTVTDNTASGQGGGVYVASAYASFELGSGTDAGGEATVGQVYGNTAILGQDVYAEYSSSYANTSLALIKAEDMFGDDEGMKGIDWLNESTSAVVTTSIDYDPVKKAYPFTLEYETNTVVAVIWNTTLNDGNGGYQTFTSVQSAVDALLADKTNSTGYYYTSEITDPEIIMVDDAKGDVEISGGQTMTLNLNGYTLTGNTTAITCYGTLTIKDVQYTTADDSSSSTYCAHYNELVSINQTVHDNNALGAGAGEGSIGTITGTAALTGGGVYVCTGGYVTMVSGQIANCTAGGTTKNNASYGGAGVYIESGTFVLSGTASINNCSTKSYGSAVYLNSTSGTFILEGDAVITNNSSYFGTVYVRSGTFKMTDGTITGNTAIGNTDNNYTGCGGGVYVYAGTVKMTGGEITGNTATGKGGGIYINSGTVTLSSAIKVTDNTVTGTSTTDASVGGGGGIYVNSGTLNIKTGAVISDNSSIRGGGIYQYNGTIKMTGGQITNNTAEYGGGLAQYPTVGGVFTMTGGVLCDNTSNLSSAGNDVYSISESGYTYTTSGTGYPTATLIRAADMDYKDESYTASYNVWKDDTYTGTVRTGTTIGSGQYITASITASTGLQLTAAKYGETTATTSDTTTYYMKSFTINSISDGSSVWDTTDGAVTAYNTGTDTNDTWQASATDKSGNTYDLTKNPTAASWTAGNDENASNGLVRSYDIITYSFTAAYENSDGNSTTTSESEVTDYINMYVEMTIPLSADDVEYGSSSLSDVETVESDDGTSLTITGYMSVLEKPGSQTVSFTLRVKGMTNGSLVQPSFSCWIEGSTDATTNETIAPVGCTPSAITVSATGMYDVTLLRNTELSYTGYFDLTTGEETTEDAFDECTDGTIIYGTMLGYGITLSMRNAVEGKGKKGMESPVGEIEFDLEMTGELYLDSVALEGTTAAPYVWAYKANENTETGSSLNNTLKAVNMNWNDEDDTDSTTQYAYNAAPFNVGSNAYSCYSGGAWSASGSQPTSGETTTTVHFSVSGYIIEPSYSGYNPSYASDKDETSTYFKSNDVKPFSAGYIQVIFPIDPTTVAGKTGSLQVSMESIANSLSISDSTGEVAGKTLNTKDPSADSDLASFVEWYGEDDFATYATGEVNYLNNYCGIQTDMYVSSGGGETLTKTNYFKNSSNSSYLSSNSGKSGDGSTAIGSTVYIGSDVTFGSNSYALTDPTDDHYKKDFDSQDDNYIEYDYLTALDILQKIDADAYVPAGGSLEIVNQTYTVSSSSKTYNITDDEGNTIFSVKTDETTTDWSTTKTYTFTLTVLYAAKTTGDNWDKDEYIYDGKTYPESPVADMVDTHEEDLIYFTSMQDLYDYFGYDDDGNAIGHCVGILYEFRDCCIRNGRSISVTAATTVLNDFDLTGNTYCVTNEVMGWTTYRPDYKAGLNTAGTSVDSDLLYSFSWHDCVKETTADDITVYGTGDGTFPDSYAEKKAAYTDGTGYTYSDSKRGKIENYTSVYVKTEYENGWTVSGTHTSWYYGNTLLLYTMDSNIDIEVATILEGSTGTPKTSYNVGNNQDRTVEFTVTPTISESSGIANELVSNGSQSTQVVITITLPKYLNYNTSSLTFDYTKSDYVDGDLIWDITYTENSDSTTTIVLKTSVTDINKVLPVIDYSCTIGNPGGTEGVDEVPSTGKTECISTAEIGIVYEESGQISTYSKKDTVTITVSKTTADNIWLEGSGSLELGDDFWYTVTYYNNGKDATTVEVGDVLPYNDDGRETDFTGGYQVTSVTLEFSDSTSCDAFLSSGGLTFNNTMEYDSGQSIQKGILSSLYNNGVVLFNSSTTYYNVGTGSYYKAGVQQLLRAGIGGGSILLRSVYAPNLSIPILADFTTGTGVLSSSAITYDPNELTITFDLTQLDSSYIEKLTQYESTGTGIGFYFYLPSITANNQVQMTFTLTPCTVVGGLSQLIVDPYGSSEQQEGGNTYINSAFYLNAGGVMGGTSTDTPINSPIGTYIVVERTIEGVAWLDLDMDGKYSDETLGDTDLLLQGIDVYLYSTYKTKDQAGYDEKLVEITEQGGVYTASQIINSVTYSVSSITASVYNDSTGEYEDVTLYPVVDVLGNLVTPQVTAGNSSGNPGGYSFTQLAATYVVDANSTEPSEEYYVIFKDDNNDYSVVGTNEQPLTFSQLSMTKTTTLAQSTTGLFNRSYASYGNSSSGLTLASISGVEMPSVNSIVSAGGGSGGSYSLMTLSAGLIYTSLTVEKVWENMFEEVPEGTVVTFTIKGTSTSTSNSSYINTYTNTYVFKKGNNGSTSVECTSATVTSTEVGSNPSVSGSTFSSITVDGTTGSTTSSSRTLTVSESPNTTGFRSITWSLSNVLLTYSDNYGVIDYVLTDIVEVDGDNNAIKGFVTELSTTYNSTDGTYYYYTAKATNTQILYELDLYKIGSSKDAYLAGAEFTLYTDQDCASEVTNVSDSATGTSGAVANITVDSDNGKLTIGKLPAGKYYLKETSAPSGYELNQSVWEIEIKYVYDVSNDDWATTPVITVTQIKDKNGEIISGGGTPLNVTNSSGTGTTGDVYYTSVSGTVGSATEYTLSYKIQNEINYSMPSAGSIGIGWTSIGGIAMMLLAIWMVLREKEKDKRMKQN